MTHCTTRLRMQRLCIDWRHAYYVPSPSLALQNVSPTFPSRPSMGKAKPAKHTSAELKAKARAATQNVGGGKAGLADRKGGAAGHQKFKCVGGVVAACHMRGCAHIHWQNLSVPFNTGARCPFAGARCAGSRRQT